MEKVMLDIAGMRCGSCAAGIELALVKKKGVKSAKVSLIERLAYVEYDPAIAAASDISKAVNDLGPKGLNVLFSFIQNITSTIWKIYLLRKVISSMDTKYKS